MKNFARIFDTEYGQLLVYVTEDEAGQDTLMATMRHHLAWPSMSYSCDDPYLGVEKFTEERAIDLAKRLSADAMLMEDVI